MYFETHAGLLAGKLTLIDNGGTTKQINISTNNKGELLNILARYACEYNAEYIKTNNPAYAAKAIEQKVNELLTKEYNYNKHIRMEYAE